MGTGTDRIQCQILGLDFDSIPDLHITLAVLWIRIWIRRFSCLLVLDPDPSLFCTDSDTSKNKQIGKERKILTFYIQYEADGNVPLKSNKQ